MSSKPSVVLIPEDDAQPDAHSHASLVADDPERGLKEPPSQLTLGDADVPATKSESDAESTDDKYAVALEQEDDPKCLPIWRKWVIVLVICSGALCATCASSMVRPAS